MPLYFAPTRLIGSTFVSICRLVNDGSLIEIFYLLRMDIGWNPLDEINARKAGRCDFFYFFMFYRKNIGKENAHSVVEEVFLILKLATRRTSSLNLAFHKETRLPLLSDQQVTGSVGFFYKPTVFFCVFRHILFSVEKGFETKTFNSAVGVFSFSRNCLRRATPLRVHIAEPLVTWILLMYGRRRGYEFRGGGFEPRCQPSLLLTFRY